MNDVAIRNGRRVLQMGAHCTAAAGTPIDADQIAEEIVRVLSCNYKAMHAAANRNETIGDSPGPSRLMRIVTLLLPALLGTAVQPGFASPDVDVQPARAETPCGFAHDVFAHGETHSPSQQRCECTAPSFIGDAAIPVSTKARAEAGPQACTDYLRLPRFRAAGDPTPVSSFSSVLSSRHPRYLLDLRLRR